MENTATVATETVERKRRTRQRGQRGSIVKRGEVYAIIYRTREGKQKWEGGFAKKGQAQKRLGEVLIALGSNRYVERSDKTFKQFCDEWMENAKVVLKPKTWASYQSALKNWITRTFGERPLCDIRKADVINFLYGMLKDPEISRKFVRNVHILLHRLFEAAIGLELLEANPAHKSSCPRRRLSSGQLGQSSALSRLPRKS